jgi:formamidopyrimidine-DNA glycosylase
MPELPEVELVVRDLNACVVGRTVTGAKVIWPGYIEGLVNPGRIGGILKNQRITGAQRRGKFILISLERHALLNHLRMTGSILKLGGNDEIAPHTHVLFYLDDGSRLAFSDVRKFGRLRVFPIDQLEQTVAALGLGLEPFGRRFNGANLARLCAGRSRSIKNLLLDQTAVAGIGNIYASEILFTARINPFRAAGSLAPREISRTIRATRKVLQEAIDNGGSSINDYVRVDGELGAMQDNFRVYGRAGERCFRCKGTVSRGVLVGRSTFWCGGCQL